MSEIERMFTQHGHRLKAALERLNELGNFGGQVVEAVDEYGYNLECATWVAEGAFSDGYEYGDADEVGRLANITVFCSAQGGQLLSSFTPNNYTATCWCDLSNGEDKEELLMRLDDLDSSLEEFAASIAGRLSVLPVPV